VYIPVVLPRLFAKDRLCGLMISVPGYIMQPWGTASTSNIEILKSGASGSLMVKALGYKPEGRGFETRSGDIFNLPNPSGRTRPWDSLSL
jgi:hypothetical protein